MLLLLYRVGTHNVAQEMEQEGNGPWDSRATMVMAPEVQFDFEIELSDLDYPDIHVHVASNQHLNFGGLRGHGDLQTDSEVTSDPQN